MAVVLGGPKKAELREVSSGLKEIRVSPWTLNLLARLVRGLPVVDAAAQLEFCKKKHTGTVFKAIQVQSFSAIYLFALFGDMCGRASWEL